MTNNYIGDELAAFKSYQHSTTRKWIDKRRRVADREHAFGRTRLLATETFPRSAQPLGFRLCVFECVSRTPVLHHQLAHHEIGIGMVALHLLRRNDEAQVAEVAFDAAQ